MKSIRIACTAIALTGATLSAVAVLLGSPDRLVGQSYERALAFAPGAGPNRLVASANETGSEHFWLTAASSNGAHAISPATIVNDTTALSDIKKAIATAGTFDAGRIEVIDVQDIARASLDGQPSAGRSLLVTAKVPAGDGTAEQTVRFVLDAGASSPAKAARAL